MTTDNSSRKLIVFAWTGSKYKHLSWLLPLLPKCHHFVDVYGGAGSVIINRDPSPIETYNDLDSGLYTFFKTLRENPDGLINALSLTPYSREEYCMSIQERYNHALPDIEKARLFHVRAEQNFRGCAHEAHSSKWGLSITSSSFGMASSTSKLQSKIKMLPTIAQRLLRVQIENSPAIKLINRLDTEDTLFYCDPPYLKSAQRSPDVVYAHEMDEAQHIELAATLNNIKGRAAISGYESPLYDTLYKGWQRNERSFTNSQLKFARTSKEILWTNYDTHDQEQRQLPTDSHNSQSNRSHSKEGQESNNILLDGW